MRKQESNQSFSESTDNGNDICQSYTPKAKVVKKQTVDVDSGNANTAAFFKRVYIFLEDGDWDRADEYCEKVLDIDPENAEAYVGKLMAELQVHCRDDLQNQTYPFAEKNNFKKAVRFGNENLKDELNGYITHIIERNKNEIYDNAVSTMNSASTEKAYKHAAKIFKKISGWKDADNQVELCEQKVEELCKAKQNKAKKRKKIAAIVTPIIVCVLIAFLIVLTTVIIPNVKYYSAVNLYNTGMYDEAIAAFQELNGYKDSEEQITKCETAIKDAKYNFAVYLYKDGRYDEAITTFNELNGYKDSTQKAIEIFNQYRVAKLKEAAVGDIVYFGKYEQDNITSNGKEDIEWLVLTKEGNKVLLISDYALDCQPYNTSDKLGTWETCSLRKWLNTKFINSAFSSLEQNVIISSAVTADYCNDTTDKVFLLDNTEVIHYILDANTNVSEASARQCRGTAYCYAQGAEESRFGNCMWWLRSPVYYEAAIDCWDASYVNAIGSIDESSVDAHCAVRPAMWINIGS